MSSDEKRQPDQPSRGAPERQPIFNLEPTVAVVAGLFLAIHAAQSLVLNESGRNELLGWVWGKDGTVDGLQAILDGDMVQSVQTPPFFGKSSVKAFEDYKAGTAVEPLVFVPKETFDAHTPANRTRVEERIKELKAMGVGCC